MDYGFAPGSTAQDGRARNLFARRANTKLVSVKSLVTLRGFSAHLLTAASVTRPIDDALLGAHANSEGWIFIPMFPGQKGPTNFETLEKTLATAARSVAIDDTVIGFTAGDPITHSVHFKGCNIGKAPAFLTKFKEALGDNVNVTAPKHFHGLWEQRSHGTWEYMAYEFVLRRETAFANRAALITDFDTEGFQFIDSSTVPTADWSKWVPKKIKKTAKFSVTGNLGVTIGKRKTIDAERQFRVDTTPFTWALTFPNAGSVPTTAAARQAAFETSVTADPVFDPTHAYPWYERLGYASLADFFAGYTWSHSAKKKVLHTIGRRFEYTILVPIVDMATGNLVFNFHPSAAAFAPISQLVETDPVFFETV